MMANWMRRHPWSPFGLPWSFAAGWNLAAHGLNLAAGICIVVSWTCLVADDLATRIEGFRELVATDGAYHHDATGPCFADSGLRFHEREATARCMLRAGHDGAHEHEDDQGRAIWTDEHRRDA